MRGVDESGKMAPLLTKNRVPGQTVALTISKIERHVYEKKHKITEATTMLCRSFQHVKFDPSKPKINLRE